MLFVLAMPPTIRRLPKPKPLATTIQNDALKKQVRCSAVALANTQYLVET